VVILKDIRDSRHDGTLVTLKASKELQSQRGNFKHSELIGRKSGDLVLSHLGKRFLIQEPSLADYVVLKPGRYVTPIYPQDANVIVSLLDIHVSPPTPDTEDDAPLEMLEIGTGNGALTLHLARAIHAANGSREMAAEYDVPIEDWKRSRKAVLHTLDINAKHSAHAAKVVQDFRHGLYAGNVDFHVGDVPSFFEKRNSKFQSVIGSSQEPEDALAELERSVIPKSKIPAETIIYGTTSTPNADVPSSWPKPANNLAYQEQPIKAPTPFLAHCTIDTPNSHQHLDQVSQYLLQDGKLIVFNPSITQVANCVQTIRRQNLPLQMETVVELGRGMSGGREWNVQAVRPRYVEKESIEDSAKSKEKKKVPVDEGDDEFEIEAQGIPIKVSPEEELVLVCRPKVGKTVVGGGFIGVWRKRAP